MVKNWDKFFLFFLMFVMSEVLIVLLEYALYKLYSFYVKSMKIKLLKKSINEKLVIKKVLEIRNKFFWFIKFVKMLFGYLVISM